MKIETADVNLAIEWLRSDAAKEWRDNLCRTNPLLVWRFKRAYYGSGTIPPDVCEELANSLEKFVGDSR